jgi:hypothetical protein
MAIYIGTMRRASGRGGGSGVDGALGLQDALQVAFLRVGALKNPQPLFAIANVPNIRMH